MHRGNDFWQTKAENHLMSKIVLGNTVNKPTLFSGWKMGDPSICDNFKAILKNNKNPNFCCRRKNRYILGLKKKEADTIC